MALNLHISLSKIDMRLIIVHIERFSFECCYLVSLESTDLVDIRILLLCVRLLSLYLLVLGLFEQYLFKLFVQSLYLLF